MKENKKTPFAYWVSLMFTYLKLTEQIGWSWFWVLFPVIIFLVFGIIGFITEHYTEESKKIEDETKNQIAKLEAINDRIKEGSATIEEIKKAIEEIGNFKTNHKL